MNKGKPILLTGGCRFIGSNLAGLALQKGFPVINLDKLTYAGNPDSLADVEAQLGGEIHSEKVWRGGSN